MFFVFFSSFYLGGRGLKGALPMACSADPHLRYEESHSCVRLEQISAVAALL